MSKVNDFITKDFNEIIKDSREYRSYELGIAYGFFQLYSHIKHEDGVDYAKKVFKVYTEGTDRYNEYFRKLIEIDDSEDAKKGEYKNERRI